MLKLLYLSGSYHYYVTFKLFTISYLTLNIKIIEESKTKYVNNNKKLNRLLIEQSWLGEHKITVI